jgi:hypothetical protein
LRHWQGSVLQEPASDFASHLIKQFLKIGSEFGETAVQ